MIEQTPSAYGYLRLTLFAILLGANVAAFVYVTTRTVRSPYQDLAEALLRDQPYFGEAMAAGQAQPLRSRHFISVLKEIRGTGSIHMIEIGSWAGQSTVIWAKALQELDVPGTIIAVDPWIPYFDTSVNKEDVFSVMNAAAKDGSIYRLFLHNIKTAGIADRIDTRIGKSVDVLPSIPDHSIDLIYIDGSHA